MDNSNKLFPRVGIGILILNENRQLLLGRRKGSHGDGTWQSSGGHLEFGEEFETCVQREVNEEIGFKIKNIQFAKVTNDIFPKDQKHYVTIFFTCEYDSGQIQKLESHKCEEWKWFNLDNLPGNLFLPYNKILDSINY